MADIFNTDPNPGDTIELGLNDLVGEGRKYSNPDELAKAYANSESFIEQLKRENAELRAAKDIQDANNQNQKPPVSGEQEPPKNDDNPPPAPNSSTPSADDFRSQIREEVLNLNAEERATRNLDTAARRLADLVGGEAKATEAIRKRAQELNVSVEWLRDTAARSPDAFYSAMGITAPSGSRTTPGYTPGVRQDNSGNVKNFEFYDRIRKEDPKTYFSAATQREMLAQAKAQGADFYKR